MTHWAKQYIGSPWVKGGNGPYSFNCWGFVRHIQHAHFGRNLPVILADEDNLKSFVREFRRHEEHNHWTQVEIPKEGDCVEMGEGNGITHIGVWIDADSGGILHCARGMGVVFSNRFTMRVRYPTLKFWRSNAR